MQPAPPAPSPSSNVGVVIGSAVGGSLFAILVFAVAIRLKIIHAELHPTYTTKKKTVTKQSKFEIQSENPLGMTMRVDKMKLTLSPV